MRQQGFDLLLQFRDRGIHLAGEGFDQAHLLRGFTVGFQAGDGFDAAYAGGNRTLGRDAKQTNFARRTGVSAAAQLHRITIQLLRLAADLDDPDGLAVFLAEELHHVFARFHLRIRYFGPAHTGVFENAFVDQFLDFGELLWRQRPAVEVECEFFGADITALLRGVPADDFVQRPVQEMRDSVMALDGVPPRFVHGERDF